MNFLLDLGTFLIGLIGHSSSLGVRGTKNVEEDVDFTVRWWFKGMPVELQYVAVILSPLKKSFV